mmetsp:Transcript_13666/g.31974  ORF Transcript_13666/g.31974 Transcript_13666/m.31974 type:complete len:545 (+) Transcript_13666:31-1665(+)
MSMAVAHGERTESYLDQIVARTRLDVAERKTSVPEAELRALIAARPPLSALSEALVRGAPLAVLAEFKKASPSKGDIAPHLDAAQQALRYAEAGCNVVSVLTEPHWFKGGLHDLAAVREALGNAGHWPRVVVLRKDFVIDEYQLLEARAHGGDTALLIVAVLSPSELAGLIAASRDLGFEPLVEVNTEGEMKVALASGAKVIGVNNRNLHTFSVDMGTTERLGKMVPAGSGIQLVSLSGVSKPEDVAPALAGGAAGVLVGEALMRAEDPKLLITSLKEQGAKAFSNTLSAQAPLVKVCGLKNPEAALCALEAGADLLGLILVQGSKRTVSIEQAAAIVTAVKVKSAALGKRESGGVRMPDHSPGEDPVVWFKKGTGAMAEALAQNGRPLVVGVFQDQEPEFINSAILIAGIDLVQLHGHEPADFSGKINAPCIRVVHVPVGSDVTGVMAQLPPFVGGPIALLLDTQVAGVRGGTGLTFDWGLAAAVGSAGLPVLVAGGLSGENVADALKACTPCWGVDASSGLESEGEKDAAKVQGYVHAAKTA